MSICASNYSSMRQADIYKQTKEHKLELNRANAMVCCDYSFFLELFLYGEVWKVHRLNIHKPRAQLKFHLPSESCSTTSHTRFNKGAKPCDWGSDMIIKFFITLYQTQHQVLLNLIKKQQLHSKDPTQ